ncbi:GIY-YIG nuclease family protein [Solitalea sp. MAHUQ-68]|uniref:GIY-YIG nuclease family protein n=1 Tax=Solitalea agri TaxID=2953739 RepID=A0A9X2F5C3_9SPHI|nr:GIY-YIG nuclease family protein [Solitalea agri]MCO4292203.1 GIY-YIG nuclease family protein [Solitalea agri]
MNLSNEQKKFLESNQIPISMVFDGTEHNLNECKLEMKSLDKYFLLGTKCKNGHFLRTRSGHCIQCDTSRIAYYKRHYMDAHVYIAISQISKLLKVGFAKNIVKREKSLNDTEYGGMKDWKIVHYVSVGNAGRLEVELHKKLANYSCNEYSYYKSGKKQVCYELFQCERNIAEDALDSIVLTWGDYFPNSIFKTVPVSGKNKIAKGETNTSSNKVDKSQVEEFPNVIKEKSKVMALGEERAFRRKVNLLSILITVVVYSLFFGLLIYFEKIVHFLQDRYK